MKPMQPLQRLRVAIYCRLSEEDHDKQNPLEDSRSIQTQKAMLRDYAHQQGWDIFDIYSDDDFSGADANRPEYNRLLKDASQGCFDIVLCKHQSRFTRDMVHVERYINDKFSQWGIRYISLLDGADTSVAGNKKSRQINGLVNEWYLEDLSENVRRANITRKRQGKYLASCAVYGYKKDPQDKYHLLVDEPAAQIVRRIFKMCIDGFSLNKIASILNEEGVLPPTRYKTEIQGVNFKGTENLQKNRNYAGAILWQGSSVHRILTNEAYMGDLYQNRQRTVSYKNHKRIHLPREQWVIVENTHEPIVSRQEFELAARARASRPRITAKGRRRLFSGKLVCGFCGGSISFNSQRGANSYYRCHRGTNLGSDVCPGVAVAEKILVQAVLQELKSVFVCWIGEDEREEIVSMVKLSTPASIEPLSQQLKKKKQQEQKILRTKLRLYQDLVEEVISADMYQQLWRQLEADQQTLEEEKEKIEESLAMAKQRELRLGEKSKHLKEETLEKLDCYLRCETLTQEMLDALVEHIEVKNNKQNGRKEIKIFWNF